MARVKTRQIHGTQPNCAGMLLRTIEILAILGKHGQIYDGSDSARCEHIVVVQRSDTGTARKSRRISSAKHETNTALGRQEHRNRTSRMGRPQQYGLGGPPVSAFKAQWIVRYLDPSESSWKDIIDEYILKDTKGKRKRNRDAETQRTRKSQNIGEFPPKMRVL